jgi:hypothetical protein
MADVEMDGPWPSGEVHDRYSKWAIENNAPALTSKALTMILKSLGVKSVRTMDTRYLVFHRSNQDS